MELKDFIELKETMQHCTADLTNECSQYCKMYKEGEGCQISILKLIEMCNEIMGSTGNPAKMLGSFISLMDNAIKYREWMDGKQKAIVAGSFDPFTEGHFDIVKQAAEIFGQVYVVIFENSKKKRTYDAEKMIKARIPC